MRKRIICVVVALLAGAGVVTPSRATDATLSYVPGEMMSADECGRCHRDIHRYWKASVHATSADNWRFQDAFQRARDERGGGVDATCLPCHAPAAVYMRDVEWKKKASWEGVTCDFCHSVRSVRTDPERPFVLEPGLVKTGPLKDAQPMGHDARFSPVHTSADICAPCHQFVNKHRFTVLSTHSEWKASDYARRNVTCQSCHMRATTGDVVDPKLARVPHSTVNLHEMPGGHSIVELNRALHALLSLARRGDEVDVTVQVVNRGAGHHVPTGSPLRRIEMLVEVDGGIGRRLTANRTYERAVVDESGRELVDEAAVWLDGARVARDNRLVPQEPRVERFSFKMPRQTPVRAVAKFFYRYAGEPVTRTGPLPFLSVNAWLDAEPR
ncbi:MAG: hypothetical protein HYX76_00995 [Acidobacteria bacterium]|nr:hypothetical protein [Acidobacteriota bacterium]